MSPLNAMGARCQLPSCAAAALFRSRLLAAARHKVKPNLCRDRAAAAYLPPLSILSSSRRSRRAFVRKTPTKPLRVALQSATPGVLPAVQL